MSSSLVCFTHAVNSSFFPWCARVSDNCEKITQVYQISEGSWRRARGSPSIFHGLGFAQQANSEPLTQNGVKARNSSSKSYGRPFDETLLSTSGFGLWGCTVCRHQQDRGG